MAWRIEIAPSAADALAGIPKKDRGRIAKRIDSLAEDPRPAGHKKLKGGPDLYRIRAGDYRIVYKIDDGQIMVLVVRIGHRKEIYKRLGLE